MSKEGEFPQGCATPLIISFNVMTECIFRTTLMYRQYIRGNFQGIGINYGSLILFDEESFGVLSMMYYELPFSNFKLNETHGQQQDVLKIYTVQICFASVYKSKKIVNLLLSQERRRTWLQESLQQRRGDTKMIVYYWLIKHSHNCSTLEDNAFHALTVP